MWRDNEGRVHTRRVTVKLMGISRYQWGRLEEHTTENASLGSFPTLLCLSNSFNVRFHKRDSGEQAMAIKPSHLTQSEFQYIDLFDSFNCLEYR
jgi:hypothetical protein